MPPRKGAAKPRSKKQLDVLAAGRKKRDDNTAERRATGRTQKARLAKLMSGELTVKDLDTKELRLQRLHDGNGSFNGKPARLPARIGEQMHAEFLRRIRYILLKGTPRAAKRLVEMLDDEGVSDSVQFQAAKLIVERGLGKTPDVIHVGPENEFDRLQQGAVIFNREELGDDQEGEG